MVRRVFDGGSRAPAREAARECLLLLLLLLRLASAELPSCEYDDRMPKSHLESRPSHSARAMSFERERTSECMFFLAGSATHADNPIHLLLKISNNMHRATSFLLIAACLAASCHHVSAAAAASATAVKSRTRSETASHFLQKPFGVLPSNKRRSRLSDDRRQPRRVIAGSGSSSSVGKAVADPLKVIIAAE